MEHHNDFAHALAGVLNRFSQENGSDTPDFLLAEYLLACLATWNTMTVKRDAWWGHHPWAQRGINPRGTIDNALIDEELPHGPTPAV